MGRLWKLYVAQLTNPFEKGSEFLETGKLMIAIILLIAEGISAALFVLISYFKVEFWMQASVPEGFTEVGSTYITPNYFKVIGNPFLITVGCKVIIIALVYLFFRLSFADFKWQTAVKAAALGSLVGIPLYLISIPLNFLSEVLTSGTIDGAEIVGIFYIFAGLTNKQEGRDKKACLFVACILLYFVLSIFYRKLFI